MTDANILKSNKKKSIVLFDGVCNLCNHAIIRIIKSDKKNHFTFCSLQSQKGISLLNQFKNKNHGLDSIVLIENGKIFSASTAALRISRKMSGFWPILSIFIILPRFLRDPIYYWIAKNRYKWFGKKDSCMIPSPEIKNRFLD